ncbi:hypothetical protein NIES267_16910 [Calothrix parasitica NIES-267]|uniref:Bacterial Pleckstrin homology domain-containing protein n=1 Tax=Calothrix parasitica NIES-267 TaxID=1973488 RepID=A0A1Z4LLV1_9CYAN|nr:hypothetical protein NIES267_16910 [Calothrix parasitica NIES-267]
MNINLVEDNLKIEFTVKEQFLAVRFKKLWEIPLSHIQQVTTTAPQTSWKELRSPGTSLPGLIKAGTYYTDRGKEFWLVNQRKDNYLTIELQDEKYKRIVMTVEDNESWQQRLVEGMGN